MRGWAAAALDREGAGGIEAGREGHGRGAGVLYGLGDVEKRKSCGVSTRCTHPVYPLSDGAVCSLQAGIKHMLHELLTRFGPTITGPNAKGLFLHHP